MTKFHITLAAIAALIALPAASSFAVADTVAAGTSTIATLDTPAESSTARKIDLQAEPIEQAGQLSEPESQPAEPTGAAPETTAPAAVDAAAEPPAATQDAAPTEPQTAKRICRKFSAAIAMVIEVPCESIY